MLIIGDVANNYYFPSTNKPVVEILAYKEDLIKVKEKLNITSEPIHTNFISETYKVNDKIYVIHNANSYPPLKIALETHILYKDEFKVASPLFQYTWARMKINYVHTNLKEWEKNVKVYQYFSKTYGKNLDTRGRFMIRSHSRHLGIVGAAGYGINSTSYKYTPYHTFAKNDLFNLFTISDWSLYLGLIVGTDSKDGKDIISKRVWDTYDYTKKLDTVVEKATVDACNEYIIPEIMYYETNEEPVEDLFKKSLMNLCSLETSAWFSRFIVKNYQEVMDCMDDQYADVLFLAIKDKKLKKI